MRRCLPKRPGACAAIPRRRMIRPKVKTCSTCTATTTVSVSTRLPTVNGERRGFTLIELLIVMSIIGLLLALAMPRYFNSLERSKVTALREDLRVMRVQIDRFHGDLGRYPKSLQELV